MLTLCLILVGSAIFGGQELRYTVHAVPVAPQVWSLTAIGNLGEPATGTAWGSRISLIEPVLLVGFFGPTVKTRIIWTDLETGVGTYTNPPLNNTVLFSPQISEGPCSSP